MKKFYKTGILVMVFLAISCAFASGKTSSDSSNPSGKKIYITTNGEKIGDLPMSLPRSDTQITTNNGDVILYQGKSIVIFYGSNSWSYTRLGWIDEPFRSRLKTILGSGDVELVLSVE